MPKIAKVEPLLTTRALKGPFDYRIPESFAGVSIGAVLEVPFGKQKLLGVVTGTADSSKVPSSRLVEPLRLIDEGLDPVLIELGMEVAQE